MTGARDPSPEAQALLDAAACGLLQTADDGTILRSNHTFCSWIGYRCEELVRKKRLQDLLTMGARIFHQTHWSPLLQMQGSLSEVKLDVVHRNGSSMPMVLNAIRHEQDGVMVHEIAAYVARDRDKYERELVSSRRRLEELVTETKRLHAEAKDRALFAEQMVGIVSHDLRNPLSTITLGATVLARGEVSETQKRTLQRILRSTQRANALIVDLLDFTQARMGGGLSLDRQAIDVHQAVAHAVDELTEAYPGRALLHVREGSGACSADGNRLAQLVGNLVSNAVTYGTPESPVTVTSSIDSNRVAIAVHNDGVPIPAEVQARLFEPLTRGSKAGSAARSIGLGLFIVREIARAHGGEAQVESGDSVGTTFRATFPRE